MAAQFHHAVTRMGQELPAQAGAGLFAHPGIIAGDLAQPARRDGLPDQAQARIMPEHIPHLHLPAPLLRFPAHRREGLRVDAAGLVEVHVLAGPQGP